MIVSSVAPDRINSLRLVSFVENRQVLNLPSAVMRIRLQWSQNGLLTAVIIPIFPLPSAKLYSLAGPISSELSMGDEFVIVLNHVYDFMTE